MSRIDWEASLALFDFDGTLVDSNQGFIKILTEFFQMNGSEITRDQIEELKIIGEQDTCKLIKGWAGSRDSIDKINDWLLNRSRKFYLEEVELKPGVREFLTYLHEKKVQMGILSSTGKETIQSVLHKFGLEEYFSFIFSACDNKVMKNEPGTYSTARQCFTEADGKQIVFFDDTLSALQAAGTAGMITAAVEDGTNLYLTETLKNQCDLYMKDFRELI